MSNIVQVSFRALHELRSLGLRFYYNKSCNHWGVINPWPYPDFYAEAPYIVKGMATGDLSLVVSFDFNSCVPYSFTPYCSCGDTDNFFVWGCDSEKEFLVLIKKFFFSKPEQYKNWKIPFHRHPEWTRALLGEIDQYRKIHIEKAQYSVVVRRGVCIDSLLPGLVGFVDGCGKHFVAVECDMATAVNIVCNLKENPIKRRVAESILKSSPDLAAKYVQDNVRRHGDVALHELSSVVSILKPNTYALSEDVSELLIARGYDDFALSRRVAKIIVGSSTWQSDKVLDLIGSGCDKAMTFGLILAECTSLDMFKRHKLEPIMDDLERSYIELKKRKVSNLPIVLPHQKIRQTFGKRPVLNRKNYVP